MKFGLYITQVDVKDQLQFQICSLFNMIIMAQ